MNQMNEIIRFSLAGILVIATDVGTYTLLIKFFPLAFAKAISFTLGGVVAYLVNKYWTFKQEKKSPAEVVRFIAANGAALGLNVLINQLMLTFSQGHVSLSLAVATILTSVFTYVVFKWWVFKSK